MLNHRVFVSHSFLLGVAVILLAFSSCTRPSSVLSGREMVNLLVDLHKADGAIQTIGYNYGHEESTRIYYLDILEKHGVTQCEFDSSLVWYTAHPKQFSRIYPRVISRLDAEYRACAEANGSEIVAAEFRNIEFTALDSIVCPMLYKPLCELDAIIIKPAPITIPYAIAEQTQ